jgi:predicted permease
VISERLWERRFRRDAALIGKAIALDGHPHTVIGVMPDAFQFPYKAASLMDGALPESRTDLWTVVEPYTPSLRGPRYSVTGRLKSGVSADTAQAELRTIGARVEQSFYQGTGIRVGVRVVPLSQEVLDPIRRSLWVLFAAVGLVLVATWANVANLLLSRLTVRAGEVATRAAVGAGRLRLARQFIAESLMLSLTGGLLAVLVAKWSIELLVALASAKIPRAHEVGLDWRAFAFLALSSIAAALVFGFAPAIWAARGKLHLGGDPRMTRGYGRLRDALVVIEVAVAVVLAFGAALMIGEVSRLRNAPSGVVTDRVLTAHLTPRAPAEDYYAIEARMLQQPGVRAAGFTQLVPLQNWGWQADFSVRGRPRQGRPIAGLRYVTPGYFRALGIPIVRGRSFTERDNEGAQRVIVVNEALVRQYFGSEDPIGRDLDRGQIVGVVGDVRQSGLDRPATPEIFYPAAQNVTMASDIGMSLIVKTDGAPEALVSTVRSTVRAVNPSLAIFNIKSMSEVVDDSLWEVSLYRSVIGLFAFLVLVLAAMGLYGIMSNNVNLRRREFAIRLALGSNPSRLMQSVIGRGLRLAAIGLALGALASANLLLTLNALPVAGRPDPAAFASIGALLVAVALTACAIPALRVTSVDPVAALRQE